MAARDKQLKRKLGEVDRRFCTIKSIADEFAANEIYLAALTIYEVLVNEVIHHFNDSLAANNGDRKEDLSFTRAVPRLTPGPYCNRH